LQPPRPSSGAQRDTAAVAPSNLDLARGAIGDMRALIDLLDEDVEWDNTKPNVPADHMGIHRGKAAVQWIIESWVGTWEDYAFEIEELIDKGEHIVLAVHEYGRGRASGIPLDSRYCLVWSFRDGRIVHGASFDTIDDALAALA
jgi:ketosteroid isomerase-like protein